MSQKPYIADIIEEYFQNQRITRTQSKVSDVRQQHLELVDEVEKLHLIIEAMWELLKKNNRLSDVELVQIMREIDLKDGRLDNKVSRGGTNNCNACGKILQKGVPTCMYCGQAHQSSPFGNR